MASATKRTADPCLCWSLSSAGAAPAPKPESPRRSRSADDFNQFYMEIMMKTFRLFLIPVAVCSLLISGAPMTTHKASALAVDKHDLSAATHKELAQARRATAKYHDVAQAEADGYVNFNLYVPGEGVHYIKFSRLDWNFDPAQPQTLLNLHHPREAP